MKKIYSILILLVMLNCSCSTPPKEEGVRGVWLTNVDSEALFSRENIKEAVAVIDDFGFNCIFVVVWNKAMTTYPSKIMKEFTGCEIDTNLTGWDPLKTLIDESHARNIKVFAWFEFGFSSSYEQNGGILVEKKPGWASIDKDGNLVKKNGFEWMNALNPEVQNFLLSLIMEVVENYEIDGIQGDDRLPAMPSEGGYDSYTVKLYKKEHNGNLPPKNHQDSKWLQWRADILNGFMRKIYDTVKSADKNVLVSMAPSIYPWSKEEYLQDWPYWINEGLVDLIVPQVYRYEHERYAEEIEMMKDSVINKKQLHRFYPGILVKAGDYYIPEQLLLNKINTNREHGINGEIFFFYEGVKKFPSLFKKLYKSKVAFPDLSSR